MGVGTDEYSQPIVTTLDNIKKKSGMEYDQEDAKLGLLSGNQIQTK